MHSVHNKSVTVIDYGVGNLLSVQRALEHCGANVELTSSAKKILNADRIIFPGVGVFANAIHELNKKELISAIYDYTKTGKPFLGICLGMQMMLDSSEEFGLHHGLSLIPGRVVAIPKQYQQDKSHKIPHIGWSQIHHSHSSGTWSNTILDDINTTNYVYFVHSFHAQVNTPSHLISHCIYDGIPLAAVIKKDNLYGCQFHPEKSGPDGLKILSNFLNI